MTAVQDSPSTTHRRPTVAELRHRAEVPMLMFSGIVTAIGIAVVFWATATDVNVPGWASAALAGLIIPVFAAAVLIRFSYWREITNAVEITPDQLPEIHSTYLDMAHQMGMEHIPRLYLKNGDGALNAFASKCQVKRAFVVIYSDIVDIAYEHGDFAAVQFVLAHELGHIHCGHVDLWRQGILAVPRALLLGRSVSRAQEYTADRCAAYYAPEGATSMMVLFAGKRMYRRVNLGAYFESVDNHKHGFWMRFTNFWSSHAVGFRRMQPLRDIETTGWDVHGKML